MASLLIWLLLLWACFGAGAAALARLRVQAEGAAEEIPFAAGLGLGLLAYLVLLAGLLRQLTLPVGIALVVLVGALGWRHMVRLAREAGAAVPQLRIRAAGALPGLFLAAMVVLTAIGALAPASDNDYDGLFYHLALPKLYLLHRGITFLPWLSHSNFPFTVEMLYLLGLLLKGQALAKLFHFGFGWLTVLAVYAFGRRGWGQRAGLLGAAALAAIPLVAMEMTIAYNELAFALYAFLAVYALARYLEGGREAGTAVGRCALGSHAPHSTGHFSPQSSGWLWVSAVMCGLALGTKALALAVLLYVGLALVVVLRKQPRQFWRLAAYAGLALVVASPWYLKAYLWTGNPVYPFFYNIFGGRFWTASRAQEYTAAQRAFGIGYGPLNFLRLPWDLTLRARWFFDQPRPLKPFNVLFTTFGPLLLVLVPVGVLLGISMAGASSGTGGRSAESEVGSAVALSAPRSPRAGPSLAPAVLLPLGFALVYVAAWFPLSQNGRYLIPILPGLCAVVGFAADRMLTRSGFTRAAAAAAYTLGLSAALLTTLVLVRPAIPVVTGTLSARDYLQTVSSAYAIGTWATQNTPPNARIMVLGDEPRMFYLDRDYLLGNHANIFSQDALTHADAFLRALQKMKVTHLLIHVSTMNDVEARRGAMETRLAELIAAGRLTKVGAMGPMTLWQITNEKQ